MIFTSIEESIIVEKIKDRNEKYRYAADTFCISYINYQNAKTTQERLKSNRLTDLLIGS